MGPNHSAALSEDGNVYMFGKNNDGECGVGHNKQINFEKPLNISYFSENKIQIVDIALGLRHSLFLSNEGVVYSWGHGGIQSIFSYYNVDYLGALGHNSKQSVYIPKAINYFK